MRIGKVEWSTNHVDKKDKQIEVINLFFSKNEKNSCEVSNLTSVVLLGHVIEKTPR